MVTTTIYSWQARPSVSAHALIDEGIESDQHEAQRKAEGAMINELAALAVVTPIGISNGEVFANPSLIGLRTREGRIKWRHPGTGEWGYVQ